MVRAERFWRVTCAMCDRVVECSDLSVLREIEAEDWDCVSEANYCPACLRAARLAREQLIADGEKAFESGGQEWADWNASALNFGD